MVVHEGGRILVTGALGQIGTDLVQSLRDIYGSDHVIASDIREKKGHPCIQNGPYTNLDVLDKDGILDITRMRPSLEERPNTEVSFQAEMAIEASKEAMKQAGVNRSQIDAVIIGCANLQRAYTAVAIEIQNELEISG